MAKTTKTSDPANLNKSKPRTKKTKNTGIPGTPAFDPEALADEAMIMDSAPFTDSLKRISEQARDWDYNALSPRGPKPYEQTLPYKTSAASRAAVVIGAILFAALVVQTIYFSFHVRTLNRALEALTRDHKKLGLEVATLATIKLTPPETKVATPAAAPKAQPSKVQAATASATGVATVNTNANAAHPVKPKAAFPQPSVANAKPKVEPKTTWKSDFN